MGFDVVLLSADSHQQWLAELRELQRQLARGAEPAKLARATRERTARHRLRRAIVLADRAELQAVLDKIVRSEEVPDPIAPAAPRPALLFPGTGEQYPNMARTLYDASASFRQSLDACAEVAAPIVGADVRSVLFDDSQVSESTADVFRRRMRGQDNPHPLDRLALAQTALFGVEYATALEWTAAGIRPTAFLGYSLGEYVAACLAGVMDLADCVSLIARRALLVEQLPKALMLAIALPESELRPLLPAAVDISAVNGPMMCVVGGPAGDVAGLERQLLERHVAVLRLKTTYAFHTRLMRPIEGEVQRLLSGVVLKRSKLPLISGGTGRPMCTADISTPDYWVQHLYKPLRFFDGIGSLLQEPRTHLIEVGPGSTLGGIARTHPAVNTGAFGGRVTIAASLRGRHESRTDLQVFWTAAATLWQSGLDLHWKKLPQLMA